MPEPESQFLGSIILNLMSSPYLGLVHHLRNQSQSLSFGVQEPHANMLSLRQMFNLK